MTTPSDNLKKAREAAIDADAAIRAVRAYVDAAARGLEEEALLSLSAAVEAARAARRAAEDACMFLGAEALDRGVPARALDWNDGEE